MRSRARAGLAVAATALLALVLLGSPAAPALGATAAPPPQGCTPTPLAAAIAASGTVCVHHLLVTHTVNTQEQNHTTFTVTDHVTTASATVPNWWPSGGPVAGMVITMWGHHVGNVFQVDRWIDLTHGTGPAPEGPYPEVSALAVSSGQIPEHRLVWIPSFVFLLDPQQPPLGGDGDIHVQTANGCPGAGVTTEATPPLRGYVDHPVLPGLVSAPDTSDAPSNHLADAPPVGVPVMILGAVRYDYGFGWREIHPIRAWRFLTSAEAGQLIAECGAHTVPQLDQSGPVPAPYGFPPCTDGSEFGSPPGFGACAPQCYVVETTIGAPERLSPQCPATIKPIVTPSQEGLSETGTSSTPSTPPPLPGSGAGVGGGSGAGAPGTAGEAPFQGARAQAALERAYGTLCQRLRGAHQRRGAPYRRCLVAMARLAGGETRSPAVACRHEPLRSLGRGRRQSYYSRCVGAGTSLLRVLARARVAEN